jgi:EAL domain-containing protein (putative c-di-GMP-specific phosphodiesterase class I)
MLREVEHGLSRTRARAGEGVQVVWSGPVDVPGMASDLAQALERDELSIHYQPVLHLDTGAVVGLEALLRWRHPERGLLSSRDFIGAVVPSGLTARVGRWVLHEVCSQMTRWQTALGGKPVPPVHVNVFPSEFCDPAYVADLGEILRNTGMNPLQLRLEVEMPASGRIEGVSAEAFEFLKEAGVEVWLERFGVGALGVPELRKLPFRRVKLDPGLVSVPDPSVDEGRILRALLQLAHELGVPVAAGGIETPAQRDLFRRHYCDLGQGYLLARPADPLGIFDKFLRA